MLSEYIYSVSALDIDISRYLMSELLKRWLENKYLKGKIVFSIFKLILKKKTIYFSIFLVS